MCQIKIYRQQTNFVACPAFSQGYQLEIYFFYFGDFGFDKLHLHERICFLPFELIDHIQSSPALGSTETIIAICDMLKLLQNELWDHTCSGDKSAVYNRQNTTVY